MRQVLPRPLESVDAQAIYLRDNRPPHTERPWVALNMVSSIDGATAVGGRSGPLGGNGDRQIFFALRASADVVLVGAGTLRAEHYGPPVLSPELISERRRRNRSDLPTIAVVSRSLDIDLGSPFFTETPTRPIVITTSTADPGRLRAVDAVADTLTCGESHVDLVKALTELRQRGIEQVLCEGGPTLNGQLLADDLVDEVCLTLAPVMVAGASHRVTTGPELAEPRRFVLDRILSDDTDIFMRYRRATSPVDSVA